MRDNCQIESLTVRTFRFPTPEPEADGTLTWDSTTAVTVEVSAAGVSGLGWTYSSPAAAAVVQASLTTSSWAARWTRLRRGPACDARAATSAPGTW